MNDQELKRERRKQRALERLGTNTPRAPFAASTNRWSLNSITSRAAISTNE